MKLQVCCEETEFEQRQVVPRVRKVSVILQVGGITPEELPSGESVIREIGSAVAAAGQVEQHETMLSQEGVDIAKKRLSLIKRHQLYFTLHTHYAVRQKTSRPLKDVQLRALRVEMQKVDSSDAGLGKKGVERNGIQVSLAMTSRSAEQFLNWPYNV